MKTSLGVIGVLCAILLFGWAIFGLGGLYGAYALGFLLGLVSAVVLGSFFMKDGG